MFIFIIYLHRTILYVFSVACLFHSILYFWDLSTFLRVVVEHFQNLFIYPNIKNKVGTAPRCMFWVYVLAYSTWILFGYICVILLYNWVLISSLQLSNDKLFCKVVIPVYTPARYTWVPIALHFHQCWISLDFRIFAHQVSMQHDFYFYTPDYKRGVMPFTIWLFSFV